MTGWLYLENYNSILIALTGLLTAIGLAGMGGAFLDLIKVRLLSPWIQPVGLLAGITIFSIQIQIMGMFSLSSKSTVVSLWLFSVVIGLIWIYFSRDRISWVPLVDQSEEVDSDYAALFKAMRLIVIVIVSWLLLASIAPSSRHDETSYHIIVGSRIIQDHGLNIYRMPMEATVLPHLFYQIAQAPFHAIGLPDAGGALSWSILMLMCWFLGYMVYLKTNSKLLSILTWFVIVSQPAVINLLITVGPSAFAFLSVVVAVFILMEWGNIYTSYDARTALVLIAISSIAAVSARLFTLPLAFIFFVTAYTLLSQQGKVKFSNLIIVAILWIIAFAPIVGWLWSQSGSPLGILTVEIFKSDFFGLEAINSYKATRQLFTNQFMYRFELALWSASLWVGAGIYIFAKDRTNFKSIALALIIFQLGIIFFFTPWEIRHLTGLQFVLFALGMISVNNIRNNKRTKVIAGIVILNIPWVILSAFFAFSLSKVSLGIEGTGQFLKRNSALFEDYSQLDKILPKSAVLLIGRDKENIDQMGWYSRPPIFYSPRSTYSSVADIRNSPDSLFVIYLAPVTTTQSSDVPRNIWLPDGYKIGETVYKNPQAIFYPSRSGIGGNGLADLTVFRLVKG